MLTMPWRIVGILNSFSFSGSTVCLIVSLFCGKIFDGDFFEGEAVVIDDALVLNSYFFSSSIINGDIEHLAHDSARELREVNEGVVCLIGNSGGSIFLL